MLLRSGGQYISTVSVKVGCVGRCARCVAVRSHAARRNVQRDAHDACGGSANDFPALACGGEPRIIEFWQIASEPGEGCLEEGR